MGCTLNLFTVLDQAASRFPDHGALYHGKRRLCTWLELRDRALRIATTVRAQDTPAARIAIASENRPEIVELMFAIWAAECVLVPINYKLHPREMVQILDDAGVTQVFASQKIAAELAALTDVPIETVDAEGFSRRRAAAPSAPPSTGPGATDPSTLAWLFYTSGTTGRSKGAMLTHRSLTAMTVAHLADIDGPDENCSLIHGAGPGQTFRRSATTSQAADGQRGTTDPGGVHITRRCLRRRAHSPESDNAGPMEGVRHRRRLQSSFPSLVGLGCPIGRHESGRDRPLDEPAGRS